MAAEDPARDRHSLMDALASALSAGTSRHDEAYARLFERSPLTMWIYDVHTLDILAANDAAIDRYGYSRDEFTCLRLPDIRPAEDVPKFLELTQELPHFDRSGPWRHRRKDGSVVQVLITSHSMRYGPHDARLVIVENPDEAAL